MGQGVLTKEMRLFLKSLTMLSSGNHFGWSNNFVIENLAKVEIFESIQLMSNLVSWKSSSFKTWLTCEHMVFEKKIYLNVTSAKRYSNWFNLRIKIPQLLSPHLHEINVNQLCWINKHDFKRLIFVPKFLIRKLSPEIKKIFLQWFWEK